ncbi:hypothetical protein MHB71_17375 [Paenibacillus sp. FSL H7-0940]|uniref:hypothetical protein n=1 Tax=Paenibacillus sp. FSL H7-0940 TaxID=2921443 RepID=UPI0030EED0E4
MKKCAYCGEERKMTREHVIPDGFIRSMNLDRQIIWLNKAPTRVIEAEIIIKDVCDTCNNGKLSQLDNYALSLIKNSNSKIEKHTPKISFKYDYGKLTRWLMKICYNSARTNNAISDIEIYKNSVDYILGKEQAHNKLKFYMGFLDLTMPNVKDHEWYHLQSKGEYEIDGFRICLFRLKDEFMHNCAARAIIINSFAFLILAYTEKTTNVEIQNIEDNLTDAYPQFESMNPGRKLYLKKDKNFWWHSLVTSASLHDKFLERRNPSVKSFSEEYQLYIVTISREEIVSMDFSQIDSLKYMVTETRDSVMNYYQKVEILVDGYDEEQRELFQNEEIQKYVRLFIKRVPEIIWFLNLENPMGCFSLLLSSFINNNKVHDKNDNSTLIKVNHDKLVEFTEICLSGINKIINDNVIDNKYNSIISSKFFTALQKQIGIGQ